MTRKKVDLNEEDEILRECRRVRDELNQKYKTVDGLCAWLASLEKQDAVRRGVRTTQTKAGRSRAGKKSSPQRKAVART